MNDKSSRGSKNHRKHQAVKIRLGIVAMLLFARIPFSAPLFAEAKFVCHANKGDECAFSVFGPNVAINFVIDGGASHGLNDNTKGLKYCVNAGPKRQPAPQWPACWDNSPPPPKGHRIVKDVND